ncbi:alkylphosphonate transporter [Mycolicibacterium smegmatis]|nr:alkylphosphonate transporter [Mycolicibacterium smegmatis]ABK72006.1 alkylphosphonate uptake protein [Mycolicibacterium smegmatis MC2 155]AWT52301.1 alkylphosphonate uptake protein [Mycolicibacterium smegmatis MKD8]MCC3334350.1 alkylphosphonate transporter [Mycolicibacterium smegmatis]MCO4196544.1 alkylphosphonate transporter [Mycolicibacterium smegmatis]MDF1902992.1 alkylphosphonate transporter [Mycolicibacterium smegmatis]
MFAQHPECPACGGRQTTKLVYGMPVDTDSWDPWLYPAGCCVMPQQWRCEVCDHEW